MSASLTSPARTPHPALRLFTLVPAAWCYAVGMTVHGSDHLIRGLRTDHHHDHAAWPGPVQVFLAAVTVVLAIGAVLIARSRHPYAPAVLAVLGIGSGLTFLALHLMPGWGHVVDTFITAGSGAHITGYSWVTMTIGVSGCFILGAAAVRTLRSGQAA